MRTAAIATATALAIAAAIGALAVRRAPAQAVDSRCAALPYRIDATTRGLRDRGDARDAFAVHAVSMAPDIAACRGRRVAQRLADMRARRAYDEMAAFLDELR